MVFLLDHLDAGAGYSFLHIVATFNRDSVIIFTMEYINVALYLVLDYIHVTFDFAGGATDNVV